MNRRQHTLKQVCKGSSCSSFWYDADHARVKQQANDGTVTIYLNPRIDLGGNVEEVSKAGSTYTRHTVYGVGGPVAQILTGSQNETRYLHGDRLSSVATVTNGSGAVLERFNYDAWGKRRNLDASEAATPIKGVSVNRGYTLHEQLDNVGLVHMNARLYDPELGRFVSADSLVPSPESTSGWNRYAYVGNNPLAAIDPSGHALTYTWMQEGGYYSTWDPATNTVSVFDPVEVEIHPTTGVPPSSPASNLQTSVDRGLYASIATTGIRLDSSNSGSSVKGNVKVTFIYDRSPRTSNTSSSAVVADDNRPTSSAPKHQEKLAEKPTEQVQSPWYFRAVVPGQGLWDNARNAFSSGNYWGAAFYTSGMLAEQALFVGSFGLSGVGGASVRPMASVANGSSAAKEATGITKEVLGRKALGADGAKSVQIIERENGKMISRTHEVTKDGQVLHQHQNHTGKYGGERQFPEEWTGTKNIKAPYENIPPSFPAERVPGGRTF